MMTGAHCNGTRPEGVEEKAISGSGDETTPTLENTTWYPLVPSRWNHEIVLQHYEILRSYVEHEDDLINSRLTWMLTINGFLFTAFALLGQHAIDLASGNATPPVDSSRVVTLDFLFVILFVIAALGGAVSFIASKAIKAAHYAIACLDVIHGREMDAAQHGTSDALMPDESGGTYTGCLPAKNSVKEPNILRLPRLIGGGASIKSTHDRAGTYYMSVPGSIARAWTFLATLCLIGMVQVTWSQSRALVAPDASTPLLLKISIGLFVSVVAVIAIVFGVRRRVHLYRKLRALTSMIPRRSRAPRA
jgi:hypothetical protein